MMEAIPWMPSLCFQLCLTWRRRRRRMFTDSPEKQLLYVLPCSTWLLILIPLWTSYMESNTLLQQRNRCKYNHNATRFDMRMMNCWTVVCRLTSGWCCVIGILQVLAGLAPSRLQPSTACRPQWWCQQPSHLSPPGSKPPKNDPSPFLSGAWTPTWKKY